MNGVNDSFVWHNNNNNNNNKMKVLFGTITRVPARSCVVSKKGAGVFQSTF